MGFIIIMVCCLTVEPRTTIDSSIIINSFNSFNNSNTTEPICYVIQEERQCKNKKPTH